MTLGKTRGNGWQHERVGKGVPRRWVHFTENGRTRYCTNRPPGKDSLNRNWMLVDCEDCRNKRAIEQAVSQMRKRDGGVGERPRRLNEHGRHRNGSD